ncbi:MAG: hypothetical protein H7840_15920 [Alphaproteobacteria bacterium]
MGDQSEVYTRTTLACFACGRTPTVAEFLDACQDFQDYLHAGGFASVVRHRCACGETSEVLPEGGRILMGYVYATCSVQFCPVKYAEVPGLAVRRDGPTLVLTHQDREWRLPLGPAPEIRGGGTCGCGG